MQGQNECPSKCATLPSVPFFPWYPIPAVPVLSLEVDSFSGLHILFQNDDIFPPSFFAICWFITILLLFVLKSPGRMWDELQSWPLGIPINDLPSLQLSLSIQFADCLHMVSPISSAGTSVLCVALRSLEPSSLPVPHFRPLLFSLKWMNKHWLLPFQQLSCFWLFFFSFFSFKLYFSCWPLSLFFSCPSFLSPLNIPFLLKHWHLSTGSCSSWGGAALSLLLFECEMKHHFTNKTFWLSSSVLFRADE